MKTVEVTNGTRGSELARAWVAASRAERRRGLLGTAALLPGEGLILSPCRSVHTVGMAYPIDVLFLARDGRVVKAVQSLRPGRFTWPAPSARSALELPAGTIARSGTQVGDRLDLHPVRD